MSENRVRKSNQNAFALERPKPRPTSRTKRLAAGGDRLVDVGRIARCDLCDPFTVRGIDTRKGLSRQRGHELTIDERAPFYFERRRAAMPVDYMIHFVSSRGCNALPDRCQAWQRLRLAAVR